jgi:hypothetical protein
MYRSTIKSDIKKDSHCEAVYTYNKNLHSSCTMAVLYQNTPFGYNAKLFCMSHYIDPAFLIN